WCGGFLGAGNGGPTGRRASGGTARRGVAGLARLAIRRLRPAGDSGARRFVGGGAARAARAPLCSRSDDLGSPARAGGFVRRGARRALISADVESLFRVRHRAPPPPPLPPPC